MSGAEPLTIAGKLLCEARENRDAWQEHARADCAALGRVWRLAGEMERLALAEPPVAANRLRLRAGEIRRAVLGDDIPAPS